MGKDLQIYKVKGWNKMDMNDVIALVNTNRGNGKKESLDRMNALLEKIDNPERNLSVVHIAGTNGKGSTANFMSAILKKTSIKTGLYTSPHLEKINERIRIGSEDISDEDFIRLAKFIEPFVHEVEKELDERLYSFEILTALALFYFAEAGCELVILEAGIGGRLDSTNAIPTPEVAIITSIGMDHMKVLGNTKRDIAYEKAGIIKGNGFIVYPSMGKDIDEVIEERATTVKAKAINIQPNDIAITAMSHKGSHFSYKHLTDLTLHMLGEHQIMNAVLTIEAAWVLKEKGYAIEENHIRNGLKEAYWPGRLERIQDEPLILIDGAHNPEGVQTLKANIQTLFPNERFTFVVGMMKDKDYMAMIDEMLPLADAMYTVSPDPYRGFDAKAVAEEINDKQVKAEAFDSVEKVIIKLKENDNPSNKVIVFGSLYLIGDIKTGWNR